MELAKKIAIKLLAIIAIAVASNWVYNQWFLDTFLDDHGVLLYNQRKYANADYLYYSASSEFNYDIKNDTNKSRITTLMQPLTPYQVKPVTNAARHAGVFADVIEHLPKGKNKGIIVIMNYRSFSPEWLESHNENAVLQSGAMYKNRPMLANRFLLSLNVYDQIPNHQREERFKAMFKEWKLPYPAPKNNIENWCMVEKYGDWRQPKRQLADHFIKNYAFVLHENSPRMADFDKISREAQEKELQLIYIIVPENMELANEMIGKDLTRLMDSNRVFLTQRYHKPEQDQYVLDLMYLLNDRNFNDRHFPNEHYNYEGRLKVAQEVSAYLKLINNDN